MIKIISKKEYENLIQEIETLRDELKKEEKDHVEELRDYELAKRCYLRYEKLYIDELQKRLELAEMVRRLENERKM